MREAAGGWVWPEAGVGSPRLLMLSGIGPADHLRAVGVDVVHDLPGVGRNFHDHYGTDILFELDGPYSMDKYKAWHRAMLAGFTMTATLAGLNLGIAKLFARAGVRIVLQQDDPEAPKRRATDRQP